MRRLREVTAKEEKFRVECQPGLGIAFIRRDPIEPVPVGTYVAMVFKVMGYDHDCDGGLMARLEQVGCDGRATGWVPDCVGLYPDTSVVLDNPSELFKHCDGSD